MVALLASELACSRPLLFFLFARIACSRLLTPILDQEYILGYVWFSRILVHIYGFDSSPLEHSTDVCLLFALLQVPIDVTFGLCVPVFRAEYVEHICDNVELALTYNDL